MSTPPDRDDAFESALRARRRLVPRFDVDDDAEPPPELDRIVVGRARDALRGAGAPTTAPGPAPGRSRAQRDPRERHYRGPRWAVPFALAATVMLSFVLLMQLDPARNAPLEASRARSAVDAAQGTAGDAVATVQRDATPPREMEESAAAASPSASVPAPAAAPAPAPPAVLQRPTPAPPSPPSAPPEAMLAREVPQSAAIAEVADRPTQAARTFGAATAQSAASERDATVASTAAPPPAPAPATATAPAPAARVARESREMAKHSPAGDAIAAADAVAGTEVDEARSADAWLEQIERLRRDGDLETARKELAQFRRRFPDHPLPPTLESLRR